MRTEFERGFYKASIYTASKNLLSQMGNNEPTLCEILELIKEEHKKSRTIPRTVSVVEEEAAIIRALTIRRVLKKEQDYILENRDYQKGVALLRNEMKRKGLSFAKYYLNQNS